MNLLIWPFSGTNTPYDKLVFHNFTSMVCFQRENGDKIGLAMKTVNQTSGKDMDSNNIELRLVEYEPHFEKTCLSID